MREIARNARSAYDYARFFDRGVQKDIAVVFYRQGLFMKDFTTTKRVTRRFPGIFRAIK
jgi:hypothetical protein